MLNKKYSTSLITFLTHHVYAGIRKYFKTELFNH